MRTCCSFTAVTLLLLSAARASGQEYRFPDKVSYSRGRVYLLDQSRYEVRDLVVEGDRLSFRNLTRPGVSELELSDVELVRIATGNRGARYAIIAGALGAASGALNAALSNSSGYDVGSPAAWAVGMGAFGAAVGYLIGRGQTSWSDIYARGAAPRSAPVSPHLQVSPGSVRAGVALTLPHER